MNYDKLISKIAKAIHKAESGTQCTPWGKESKGVQSAFRDEAVVALKTLAKQFDKWPLTDLGEHDITEDLVRFIAGDGPSNFIELRLQ